VGIAKDQHSHFAPPELIERELESFEQELNAFPDDLPRAEMVHRLAGLYRQLNHIHPFREGNGRTQRVFWDAFCLEYGYELRWHLVDKSENDAVSRLADSGHFGPPVDMLDRILVPPTDEPVSERAQE